MTDKSDNRPAFGRPKCCECGIELEPQVASYEPARRLYCKDCEPIAEVKRSWQPLGRGSVSRIFVIDQSKKKNPWG